MAQYKHLFFDLDRTLWDFEKNSHEALLELIEKYRLKEKGLDSIEQFLSTYYQINEQMWADYRNGLVDKETLRYGRFKKTLEHFNVSNDNVLVQNLANDYTSISPQKTYLFPHTHEVLNLLSKKYKLHIITNGFEEVQYIKIKSCGLEHYFDQIITSEKAGFKKPDIRIFQYSMRAANTTADCSVMIGDCLDADIGGAKNAGMHQVHFNPEVKKHNTDATYEIKSLHELLEIL